MRASAVSGSNSSAAGEVYRSSKGNKLNLSFIHDRLRLFAILALAFTLLLTGRAMAQGTEFSADEIIQILEDNPDVLAEAKQQIVNQLRDRGYNVSIGDITDDRLFNYIRSDDRVRQVANDFLLQKGFSPQQQGDQTQQQEQQPGTGQPYPGQAGPQPPPTPQGRTTTGQQGPFDNPANYWIFVPETRNYPTRNRPSRENVPAKETTKRPGQEQYPLRNLPAVRDLYTQALPDETKLERFGAALFRNSTAPTDKAPLSIPVGPDY